MSRFEEARSALGLEGVVAVADGWTDPDGALGALEADGPVIVKLVPPVEDGATGDFGPLPKAPRFATPAGEGRAIDVVGDGSKTRTEVRGVRVVKRAVAWGAGATPFERAVAEILVTLGSGETLSFAGTLADDADTAVRSVSALGRALAARLDTTCEDAVDDVASSSRAPLASTTAARFSLGFEGPTLVLRDHESDGPRAGAGKYRLIALACFVPAVLSLGAFALGLRAFLADTTMGVGLVLGPLALGLVLGVAAYAFFEIARFAAKYTAKSEPLAWFADDRVVVAPWPSREGAIDTRPGGRFGTAIRTSEISGTRVEPRGDRYAVVLESAHGPYDVLVADDEKSAAHLGSLVERAVRWVASPEKKRTALLRAQERRDKRVSTAQA